MNVKEYIKSQLLDKVQSEMTDEEYKFYYQEYHKKFDKKKPSKPKKEKVIRQDKGLKRTHYNSTLPHKYKQYLSRANCKCIEFSLTVEQFEALLSKSCAYCGKDNVNTIDRVDSKLGYTIDNSVPCCQHCNTMKWSYSLKQFEDQIDRIYHHIHSNDY